MRGHVNNLVGKFGSFFEAILPPKIPKMPTEQSVLESRNETALGIVSRQAEGNVLLAAARIDMTGVDFADDGEEGAN